MLDHGFGEADLAEHVTHRGLADELAVGGAEGQPGDVRLDASREQLAHGHARKSDGRGNCEFRETHGHLPVC